MPQSILPSLQKRISLARAETDRLFRLVKQEALAERPIPERHRIIFYLGHLEAFDWNLLHERLGGVAVFHPTFDRLFAFGIDPVDGKLPDDQPSDWPSVAEIEQYRRQVRDRLDSAIQITGSSEAPLAGSESLETLANVAIEHRLMHAETLSYMLHQMPFDRKLNEAQASVAPSAPALPEVVEIPAGSTTLGQSSARLGGFGWDNEFEAQRVMVPAFTIDRFKITNGQYLEFILAGGYTDRSLWKPSNWDWKEQAGIVCPVYWIQVQGRWQYRTMFEAIPLPLDWPVYVSHAEAAAYAAWKGRRLPTEEEWQRAAYGDSDAPAGTYPWGVESPGPAHGYFNMRRWDPYPVSSAPAGRSRFGVEGLLGNGWEWTSTVFGPFPGFHAFDFYPTYSAAFFDGQHYVLKGSSPRTELSFLRPSFRNWFQAHYQYAYAGFRCVQ